MALEKRYLPNQTELELKAGWQAKGIYQFQMEDPRPVYSIDSPPATVSGHLHLGHVYSYSHADFMARFFRMRGFNVFYPMGFDDNGLPTEHYVERRLKISALQIGRQAFIEKCLQASEEAEKEYRDLWERLGLSIDWRYTYRTIDEHSRRCSQHSFIDLYQKGLAYRDQAPMIWCPTCRTAIAQADLEDRERSTEFVTLPFDGESGPLTIATTRPELLAACVAVFVHPQDLRYQSWVGKQVRVPHYGQMVPVLTDQTADPTKGTGAVMCCTFGDQADVAWWYSHKLPSIETIGEDGRMLPAAGAISGMPVEEARQKMKDILAEQGLILDYQPTSGTIRVHDRCGTPVEFRITRQWFIRILENKQKFLELGDQVHWHPEQMHARYQAWVENLSWDWCISRQRYYGVPFPVWYCAQCGEIMVADESQLPIDPTAKSPARPCQCGSTEFRPDTDIMDTWATSSVSPEIVTGWLDQPDLFAKLFPMTLRPQAHDIIRTWTFSTIVKAWYHFGKLPWRDTLISGWGIAGEGMGKISKSKGGGPMAPLEMINRYSADALRYWSASTSPGKDAVISEEKIQMGVKWVNKLWNVARFAEPFINSLTTTKAEPGHAAVIYTPADCWILSSLQALVAKVTEAFENYEYSAAKTEIESFFWRNLADNYLEMAKLRLYDPQHPAHLGAAYTLKQVLKTVLKLLAPLMPFVTDAIWQELFALDEGIESIHQSSWPEITGEFTAADLTFGELLISIASAARRYKSEHSLSLGSEFSLLQIAAADSNLASRLQDAAADLISVTRARQIEIKPDLDPELVQIQVEGRSVRAAVQI